MQVWNREGREYTEQDVRSKIFADFIENLEDGRQRVNQKLVENYLRENGYAFTSESIQGPLPFDIDNIINIASPKQIKAAFGDNSEASVSKAVEALKAENALYAQYFSGTVFDITEYKTNGVVIDTENNKFAVSGADAIDAYLQENTDGVKLGEYLGDFKTVDECLTKKSREIYGDNDNLISEQHAEDLLSRYSDAELRGIHKIFTKKNLASIQAKAREAQEERRAQKQHIKKTRQNTM